jgi:hypothetical protein
MLAKTGFQPDPCAMVATCSNLKLNLDSIHGHMARKPFF